MKTLVIRMADEQQARLNILAKHSGVTAPDAAMTKAVRRAVLS